MKRLQIIRNDELGAETRFLTESAFSDSNRNRICTEPRRDERNSHIVLNAGPATLPCGRNARHFVAAEHLHHHFHQIGVKYRNGTPEKTRFRNAENNRKRRISARNAFSQYFRSESGPVDSNRFRIKMNRPDRVRIRVLCSLQGT